ncbi:helix-turn-helix domain-containing protein [Terribacillus saccharophilus]|uniref:helix-turn-helix domain-containing protein n=1 Tax=Terribacillus saccharophilus TaxID=361277 RepID=UPI0039821546
MADHIGTTSRHVNRLLTMLANEGIIERSKNSISIKTGKKLKRLASRSIYA